MGTLCWVSVRWDYHLLVLLSVRRLLFPCNFQAASAGPAVDASLARQIVPPMKQVRAAMKDGALAPVVVAALAVGLRGLRTRYSATPGTTRPLFAPAAIVLAGCPWRLLPSRSSGTRTKAKAVKAADTRMSGVSRW